MSSYSIVYKNELYHHGILGQKRGVRNYQYEDGSLTPEGRIRYGVGPARGSSKADIKSRRDARKRNRDMSRFLAKKKEEREQEAESLKDTASRNSNAMAKAQYDEDTKKQIWKASMSDFNGDTINDELRQRLFDAVVNRREEESSDSGKGSEDNSKSEEYKQTDSKKSSKDNSQETRKPSGKDGEKKKDKDGGKHYEAVKDSKDSSEKKKDTTYKDVDENGEVVKDKNGKDINLDAYEKLGKSGSNASKSAASIVNHFENIAKINYRDGQKSVDLSHISDEEMRNTINRLNLERQYREAISSPMNASGYEKAKEVLSIAGDVLLFAGGVAGVIKTVKDIRRK